MNMKAKHNPSRLSGQYPASALARIIEKRKPGLIGCNFIFCTDTQIVKTKKWKRVDFPSFPDRKHLTGTCKSCNDGLNNGVETLHNQSCLR